MRAMDKHRLKRALIIGDASDTQFYADAAGEIGSGILKAIVAKQAADEQKKKEAAQKAKEAAANADLNAAMIDLKQKQKAAAMAHADADAAVAKANAVEADPNGPLHAQAKQAQQKAALLDADVLAAQKKVDYYQGGGTGKAPSDALTKRGGSSMPSWVMPVGIGIGVLGVGFLGYKLLSGKKRRE
jgi:pyruvate/2-oxoglutarate dehydrogenase complex dihydrolipoamide acyltransferase (E2) component